MEGTILPVQYTVYQFLSLIHVVQPSFQLDGVIDFVDAIADYFGVHIGMYFAFLGHYTMALTVPAFLGVIIWIYSGSSQVCPSYSFQ